MALVAYDYGSGSENEDEESEPNASTSTADYVKDASNEAPTNGENSSDQNEIKDNAVDSGLPEILSQLPKTKTPTVAEVVEDKLEDFVPKYKPSVKEKKPQKVKITIPALSEFEEDEEDEPHQKKAKNSSLGSSLLSILPPVRGSPLSTKSFVPHVLKNKPSDKSKNNPLVPHAVRKKAEQAKIAAIKKIQKISDHGSDAESEDDIEIPETFDDEMWQKVCGRGERPKPQLIEPVEEITNTPAINIAPEAVKPYDGLDNAAFKELVGKAKKPVNIKLIDINEEEILPDKNIWLTKSLTDPDTAPKPVIEDPVDPTRKKKHHITYLAEQAKANEQELQSQWSSNKFARNQTRAKYGF